jgi:hypothetical protein
MKNVFSSHTIIHPAGGCFLTPCGEPGFAFRLMALLSHQQHPPFRFDVKLNTETSIICNFGRIDASMV